MFFLILYTVQICSPISSKLGEKVLKECASTVRPYLVEALKSRSMNLDDYAEIVASICNEMPEGEQMVRPIHDYFFSENVFMTLSFMQLLFAFSCTTRK